MFSEVTIKKNMEQRSSLYIAHLPLRNILAPHVSIYIVFFTFQLKIQLIPCQALAIISLVRRGSVILRGISLLGYVLCSQQSTVITPDEFVDYSLELLVEPVRGAISSTGQQNTAAPTSTEDYRKPSLRPVPRVHSSPHPDADVLALDRHHNGGERGDPAGRNHKISTSTQRQVSSISKSKLFSIQINLLVNISKCKSF